MANPQRLNLYSYVLNNAVTAAGPDGHYLGTGPGAVGPNGGVAQDGCPKEGCTVTVVGARPADIALDFVRSELWQAYHNIRNSVQSWRNTDLHYCESHVCEGTVLPEGPLDDAAEALLQDEAEAATSQATTLQTDGTTLSKSTARALNRQFHTELEPREWGRALERLKKANGLDNDFLGKIMSNGDYVDPKTRTVLDNIGHYLNQ